MIIAGLVVVALVLLVLGLVFQNVVLAGVAVLAALLAALAFGAVLLRRVRADSVTTGDAGPTPARADSDSDSDSDYDSDSDPDADEADEAEVEVDADDAAEVDEAAEPATKEAVPFVCVVPGRRRYHRNGCGLLDGHEAEEVTVDDARDEGFTPCSRCTPDVVPA